MESMVTSKTLFCFSVCFALSVAEISHFLRIRKNLLRYQGGYQTPRRELFRAKFPEDPVRRAKWILAVGRKNWKPSRISILCSDHFTEDQIDRSSLTNISLHNFAVPVIFKKHPAWLQKKKEEMTLKQNVMRCNLSTNISNGDVKRICENGTEAESEQNGNLTQRENIYFSPEPKSREEDIFEKFSTVCSENRALKLELKIALEEKKKHLEKISLLEQACLLQQLEVTSLNSLIEELKNS